jgi:hypothetical protein
MSEDKHAISPRPPGFFTDLSNRFKLIFRLMGDRRVSPFIKILPIGSLVYFIVPDLVLGPIDDAVVIWLGTYVFVELCPPDVVQEHMDDLNGILRRDTRGESQSPPPDSEDIIDAEFTEEER